MENKDKKRFWERLQTFVKDVQVNDHCSEDEQEMILHVCQIQISMLKQMKKVDFFECEKEMTDLGNYLLDYEKYIYKKVNKKDMDNEIIDISLKKYKQFS